MIHVLSLVSSRHAGRHIVLHRLFMLEDRSYAYHLSLEDLRLRLQTHRCYIIFYSDARLNMDFPFASRKAILARLLKNIDKIIISKDS